MNKTYQEIMEKELDERSINPDPIKQFTVWFDEAVAAQLVLPNAMSLATATPDGKPSSRILLLKDVDAKGFVFYTNYLSRKGHELALNPSGAMTFYWAELERQVRIEGMIEKITREESEEYFQSRPRGSQIGAHASAQSEVVGSRTELEERFAAIERQFDAKPVPCPPHWGGYLLRPNWIEFWQGRPNRFHDRILYRTRDGRIWTIHRMAP